MDIHEKNRVIFQAAKQYLEQNANPQKCQRYLAKRDIHSLEDAFEVAVRSINDQTMLGGVIGYGDGKEGRLSSDVCLILIIRKSMRLTAMEKRTNDMRSSIVVFGKQSNRTVRIAKIIHGINMLKMSAQSLLILRGLIQRRI